MSNTSDNLNTQDATPRLHPVATPDAPDSWPGMTLDDLRRARGKALVRRELGRASMQNNIDGVRSNIANNGVRALMFSPETVSHLKTADYVLLGFRVARWIIGLRNTRRRRRRDAR